MEHMMSVNTTFYRHGKLLHDFERVSRQIMPILASRYGQVFSENLLRDARQEFEMLIPAIPYIGGSKNRWTSDLIESVQLLAFFRAMKKRGKTPEESGEIVRKGMQARLSQYPRFLLKLIGRLQFSRLFLRQLEKQSLESQKREYPGNFVAHMVYPDDHREFDWGIDFTECAIYSLYKAQDACEFLPYVCRLDEITSEAFGLGMERTSTLSGGADRCNPRLKRD
jgi:L-2-amino-thiazoline-4-carboxylic acid hydrolase-like protein